MSQTSDAMELREEDIEKHLPVALSLLQGFDHAPRIGRAASVAPTVERSSGIGTRRRFRSTTPGLVTQRVAATGVVALMARVEGVDEGDALITPLQATVLHALRRAIAVALAVAETVAEQSGLGDLKRANLQGSLPPARKAEFSELLAAEALVKDKKKHGTIDVFTPALLHDVGKLVLGSFVKEELEAIKRLAACLPPHWIASRSRVCVVLCCQRLSMQSLNPPPQGQGN